MSNGIYLYYDTEKKYVVYVGRDSYIDKNKRHKAHMLGNQQFDKILQNNPDRYEYRVYCEGNFSNEELNNLETQTIKLFDTFHREDAFNYTEGGEGIVGFEHSEESKRKISEANSGENHPMYGKKHPKETRKKMSEAHKGKKIPEETRKKMSESKSGENHPMYGRKHSEESKKKMSETNSGENNPNWKDNARVVKCGFRNGKQNYTLKQNGKTIKQSIYKEKLEKLAEERNKKQDKQK